jgi:hypothetical protein
MLLNDPHTQHHKRIEALPLLSLHPQSGGTPPIIEYFIIQLWFQFQQSHWLKEASPDLPSEDARDQEVINGFSLLVTYGALLWMVHTPLTVTNAYHLSVFYANSFFLEHAGGLCITYTSP